MLQLLVDVQVLKSVNGIKSNALSRSAAQIVDSRFDCDHWSLHWHGSRGSPANDRIEQIIFTVCLRFRHCSHSISSEFAPHFGHISALTFVCLTEICSDTLLPLFALLSFLCPMKTVHASGCIDTDPTRSRLKI